MKNILILALAMLALTSNAQIKVKDLPTTTTGSTSDYLIKDNAAGTSGSTKKISVANFISTYSLTPGIVVGTTTITSGTTGAIPFNDGGVYGEDATKFFWDKTNNRLGVNQATSLVSPLNVTSNANDDIIHTYLSGNGVAWAADRVSTSAYNAIQWQTGSAAKWIFGQRGNSTEDIYAYDYTLSQPTMIWKSGTGFHGFGYSVGTPSAAMHIFGTGSTSSTYALKVINASAANLFNVRDDGTIYHGSGTAVGQYNFFGNGNTDATINTWIQNTDNNILFGAWNGGQVLIGLSTRSQITLDNNIQILCPSTSGGLITLHGYGPTLIHSDQTGTATNADLLGTSGNDLRIAATGAGTNGKGIYLNSYDGTTWKTQIKILNRAVANTDAINLPSILPFADNTAAGTAGLVAGDMYYTDVAGEYILKIVH